MKHGYHAAILAASSCWSKEGVCSHCTGLRKKCTSFAKETHQCFAVSHTRSVLLTDCWIQPWVSNERNFLFFFFFFFPPSLLCRQEAALLYHIEQYLFFISRTAWTLRPYRPDRFFEVMWIFQDSVLKTLYKQGSDVEELDQPEDLQGDMEDYGESWNDITEVAVPIASSGDSNHRCSLFYKREGLSTPTRVSAE